jgi:chromosome segregation ATPase
VVPETYPCADREGAGTAMSIDQNTLRDWELNRLRMELVSTQEKWMKSMARVTALEHELAEAKARQREYQSATVTAAETAAAAIERLERAMGVVLAAVNMCSANPEETADEEGARLGQALWLAVAAYQNGMPS